MRNHRPSVSWYSSKQGYVAKNYTYILKWPQKNNAAKSQGESLVSVTPNASLALINIDLTESSMSNNVHWSITW